MHWKALAAGILSALMATAPGRAAAKDAAALTALDYIEIQQLVNRYAFAIDNCTNNGYDYADLYTPDGVFYWGVGSRKSVGREELAEAAGGGKNGCRKLERATAENPVATHTTVNLIIEPSPEGATGKSYLMYPGVMGTHSDPSHTGHVGGYQDVYVKTAKGWRFKSRLHVFPPDVPGTVDIAKVYGPPSGEVVGSSGTVSPIVANLDASTAFYVGLLGLTSDAPTVASAKDTPPPPILRLEGTPDGRMRWNHVPYPGSGWRSEFLEFTEIERSAAQLRIQDPGTATVVLRVRDIDALVAKLKQAGTPVLTRGGAPVTMQAATGTYRAIIVRDPDGHFVEFRQPDQIPADAPPGERHRRPRAHRDRRHRRDDAALSGSPGIPAAPRPVLGRQGVRRADGPGGRRAVPARERASSWAAGADARIHRVQERGPQAAALPHSGSGVGASQLQRPRSGFGRREVHEHRRRRRHDGREARQPRPGRSVYPRPGS